MKKFESLKDENLLECLGGQSGYNCYKFGKDVGRTVKLVAPIVIPLFCC